MQFINGIVFIVKNTAVVTFQNTSHEEKIQICSVVNCVSWKFKSINENSLDVRSWLRDNPITPQKIQLYTRGRRIIMALCKTFSLVLPRRARLPPTRKTLTAHPAARVDKRKARKWRWKKKKKN